MVGWIFRVTIWLWFAAEALLQIRQVRRSGRTSRTEWRSLVLFNGLAIAGFALAGGPVAHAFPGLSYRVGAVGLGLLLIPTWLGIGLRLWSIVTLGRFFRATVHIQEGHQVVSRGPYRVLRHPSYSGILLALAAAAVTIGNPLSWLTAMAGLGIAVWYRIRVEEAMLTEALGEAYTSYAARTSRLVPGLW